MADASMPPELGVRLLDRLAAAIGGSGVVWSAEDAGELNVNLVRLEPGASIDAHVNREVDVVIIVIDGMGRLEVGDLGQPLSGSVLAVVPKGARRSVRAGADGLAYVTVHRRRGPLGIGRRE
jgi:quercetin dioxygenase-like cupin family protein